MITPRTTRLIRARNPGAFRGALRQLAIEGDLASARRRVVIVPTRTAAEQLRRGLEEALPASGRAAIALPHLRTRDQWRTMLVDALAGHPAVLSPHEREVLLGAAARDAIAAGSKPPFTVRPGLLALMLEFYDGLRRHLRSVDDFERLVGDPYAREVDTDRGAVRLLAQTRFLAESFRGYEERLVETGTFDEHRLRQRLLDEPAANLTHVIVAVGDRTADAHGLWLADFDLLARQAGITRVDVVTTDAILAAGFLERVHGLLPGIEEVAAESMAADTDAMAGPGGSAPTLVAPPETDGPLFATHRDREEELRAVVRQIKKSHRTAQPRALRRTGIVFRRPLPYVYLASQVLPSAGVPYQSFDALPLASEPYAAALDLVFDCLESEFARLPLVSLLRSPMFVFHVDGRPITASDVSAFDRALSEARYFGDDRELAKLLALWSAPRPGNAAQSGTPAPAKLVAACRAAVELAAELAPLTRDDRPSAHCEVLLAFLDAHMPRPVSEITRERLLRARGAIHASLRDLRDAHRAHDDARRAFDETAAAIRRWVGHQTFAPRCGRDGVHLLDMDAARFGDFHTLYLVGLTQGEWPGSERRSVFYPASLLSELGWPKEADARAADRAVFEDLLRSPAQDVVVSTFTLENDAIVEPSPYLEDLSQAGLSVSREDPIGGTRIFEEDALLFDPPCPEALRAPAPAWLALRASRTPSADRKFHGQSFNPNLPAYKVSSLDQYLGCPFAFFSTHVLRLQEDPDDEESLGPKEQGKFVHEVLQRFYEAWQSEGRGAITGANLDEARQRFAEVVETALARLPESDAALQRLRLLGSPVSPGMGDTVFRIEAEDPVPVVERLLEFSLNGDTLLRSESAQRTVPLRATADRIDLLADGSFRLIDYKLSHAPKKDDVVQLPAYAASAAQKLEGRHGRSWRPSDAAYIAFGKAPYVPLARNPDDLDAALQEGEERLISVVDSIERGQFPPSPNPEFRCSYCPFASVCRKDYVGDQ